MGLILQAGDTYREPWTDDDRELLDDWLIEHMSYLPSEVFSVTVVNEGVIELVHLIPDGGDYLILQGEFVWKRELIECPVPPPFLDRFTRTVTT